MQEITASCRSLTGCFTEILYKAFCRWCQYQYYKVKVLKLLHYVKPHLYSDGEVQTQATFSLSFFLIFQQVIMLISWTLTQFP